MALLPPVTVVAMRAWQTDQRPERGRRGEGGKSEVSRGWWPEAGGGWPAYLLTVRVLEVPGTGQAYGPVPSDDPSRAHEPTSRLWNGSILEKPAKRAYQMCSDKRMTSQAALIHHHPSLQ